jgi:hypothetical protein
MNSGGPPLILYIRLVLCFSPGRWSHLWQKGCRNLRVKIPAHEISAVREAAEAENSDNPESNRQWSLL